MNKKVQKKIAILLFFVVLCLLTSCTKNTSVLSPSDGDLSAFRPVGTAERPEFTRSESLGREVVTVWLNDFSDRPGLSAFIPPDPEQSTTETLTVHVLLQQPYVSKIDLTLQLSGTDLSGKSLVVSEEQSVAVGNWIDVSFPVEPFFSEANLTQGYVVTLFVDEPKTDEDVKTLLYFDGVTLSCDHPAPAFLWPTVVSVLGMMIGYCGVLRIYRVSKKKEVTG